MHLKQNQFTYLNFKSSHYAPKHMSEFTVLRLVHAESGAQVANTEVKTRFVVGTSLEVHFEVPF